MVGLVLGSMKTSHVVQSQRVLILPCLFPMVLSPRKSHSCEPTWMDNPIQSFRKANPLGSRIHSFPWKKVLFSSNEQNTNPLLPKMSHSEETRHLLASTNSSSRNSTQTYTCNNRCSSCGTHIPMPLFQTCFK